MLEDQYLKINQFLSRHEDIWQKEVLYRYPFAPFSNLHNFAMQIQNLSDQQLIDLENNFELPSRDFSSELSQLMNELQELDLLIPQILLNDKLLPSIKTLKMNSKKVHEISSLCDLIVKNEMKFSRVVDFGGGVGHLCQTLVENFQSYGLCLDQDEFLLDQGKKRLNKFYPHISPKLEFRKNHIGENIKLETKDDDLVLGLHACGSLSNFLIDFFIASSAHSFINLGCCYHRETRPSQFNLNHLAKKNPINYTLHSQFLAANSKSFMDCDSFNQREKIKSYRYAFHFFCLEKFNQTFEKLGHFNKSIYEQPFSSYAQIFLDKFNLKATNHELEDFYENSELKKKVKFLIRAGIIRSLFGRAIELSIILDRALYLKDNNFAVEINQIFDTKISPRNFAIVAKKKAHLSEPSL